MSKNKKKLSAADCSGPAFLTNPVASVNEFTGMTARVPEDIDEAEGYAEMLDITVTARDGSEATGKNR